MSMIKNKANIYAIVRRDNDSTRDVVCAFTKTLEGAEELCGEYAQNWTDSGGGDDAYYYVVSNTFYDR